MIEKIDIYLDDLKDEVRQRILKYGRDKVLEQLTSPLLTVAVQIPDVEEKTNTNLPQCLSCEYLTIEDKTISPTSNEHPCLSCSCWNTGIYPDAYGIISKESNTPVWIDLVTMVAWVDGSCSIPKVCSGYTVSKLIKK